MAADDGFERCLKPLLSAEETRGLVLAKAIAVRIPESKLISTFLSYVALLFLHNLDLSDAHANKPLTSFTLFDNVQSYIDGTICTRTGTFASCAKERLRDPHVCVFCGRME
jgi:hypothetical protein